MRRICAYLLLAYKGQARGATYARNVPASTVRQWWAPEEYAHQPVGSPALLVLWPGTVRHVQRFGKRACRRVARVLPCNDLELGRTLVPDTSAKLNSTPYVVVRTASAGGPGNGAVAVLPTAAVRLAA